MGRGRRSGERNGKVGEVGAGSWRTRSPAGEVSGEAWREQGEWERRGQAGVVHSRAFLAALGQFERWGCWPLPLMGVSM